MNFSPLVKNREVLAGKEPTMKYNGGDFTAWQTEARACLSELLGLDSFVAVDANVVINSAVEKNGYTQYNFTFTTEKDFNITAYLLVPAVEKAPLLISLYGDSEDLNLAIGNASSEDRDTCVAACKAGYAVLALPIRNFDECPGTSSLRIPGSVDRKYLPTWNACYRATMRAVILARVTMGERVWDISRAIDAISASFESVDTSSVTLVGNSGAGTLAYYAAAIDTRITSAVCSSGIASWEDSIAKNDLCSCNFIPHIANFFKFGDIAGLIAPRKLAFLSYTNDLWYPTDSCERIYEAASELYATSGSDAISMTTIDGDPLINSKNLLCALKA